MVPLHQFRQSRLSRRLLTYVVVCALLFSILVTAIQMFIGHRRNLNNIQNTFTYIAEGYLEGIAASVFALDEAQLRLQMKGILNFPYITHVEVVEKRGGQRIWFEEGDRQASKSITRSYPIRYAAPSRQMTSYGILTVTADLSQVYDHIWDDAVTTFSISILGIGIFALCIFLIFQFGITRHLFSMCEYTDQLNLNQLETDFNLSRKPPLLWRNDELHQLAAALNKMRERLQKDLRNIRLHEAELHASAESLRRYEHIISSTEDLMSFVDTDYRYRAVNEAYLTAHAKKREEIVGFSVKELMGSETFEKIVKKNFDRALGGETVRYQAWFEYKGAGLRFKDVAYHPFYDKKGKIDGVVVSAHDLTRQKQVEDALVLSEHRYKKAQSMGHVGNWEYDLETEKFWGSDEAKRIYGFEPDDEYFTTDAVENCIPERERVHQALVDLIEANKPYDLEFEIHPVSGPASRTIRSMAELIRDEDGTPLRVVGVIQDITEQKGAEREKSRLEQQLRHAQKIESLGTLAGGIAHDFNNILSAIIGYTELALSEAEKGSAIEGSLQEVYTAGDRAKDLVRQILAFARQSDEERKPVRVGIIVKEALKLIRSTIPASIEINHDIKSDARIMGNATQVQQVIMNLCSNAAQAMENHGGILSVTMKDVDIDGGGPHAELELKPGEYIEISVADTGPGIAPEIMDIIFEPYFTTKELGEGTGMGLAMVNGIVASHDGKITVNSRQNEKTVFTVYLPTTRQRPAHVAYEAEPLPVGTERILFVDDEAPIANMGGMMLKRMGYSVETITNSVEALERFGAQPDEFDLVITDMTMPKMTGDVMATKMIAIRPDIPIIMCSGFNRKISDERAREIGIKAFADKPIIMADLAKKVRDVLDKV